MGLRLFLLVLLLAVATSPALAVNPNEMLQDPALEARARDIGSNLRCLVCQNQSIDESDADLARDLRVLVRDRLKNGDSNEQVVDYVVSRYGDFVLLNPPFKLKTYALWFGPAAILLFGVLAIAAFYRRRRVEGGGIAGQPAPLSETERLRLHKLMGDDK